MSTIYRGKIDYTEDELRTKYDGIILYNKIDVNFSFSFAHLSSCTINTNLRCSLNLSFKYDQKENESKKVVSSSSLIEQSKMDYKSDLKQVETKTSQISFIEDWMDLLNENCEIEPINEFIDVTQFDCIYCSDKSRNISIPCVSIDSHKMLLMNAIIKCILHGLNGDSELQSLCVEINRIDPEFLLKASLFCRREFNVRTVANYLLALAASVTKCNVYLKKYFSACINLPTDWMEVVQQYMIMTQSINLPSQLRKVLVAKFRDFNTYQIGKYQHKTLEVDAGDKSIKLSLKSLIRTLHISEPVDHVMCLLGKTYPKSNEEFVLSNLTGEWDCEKAGKRMKVPTPETWETQISINGNKPEVWEKMIDSKKLPYMAMIRNLRNILQANVKERYHDKVANMISQESKVINGKLLPFQYFTAFKVLEEYNEDILKSKEKLTALYSKTESRPKRPQIKRRGKQGKLRRESNDKMMKIRAIMKLRKAMGRPLVSENVITKYLNALNKAVEISTMYNIPSIRGRVLILSHIGDEKIYPKFKHGSSKSVKEVVALLTSMCYFASEYTDIGLVKDSMVEFYKVNKKSKSILTLSSDILKQEINSTTTVNIMFSEMITKQHSYDLILSFDVNLPVYLLTKYTKSCNEAVSIVINTINSDTEDVSDIKNITKISGFSEHTIKIISEQSNGGFIKKVDSIDKRYNLESNVICFKKSDNNQKEATDLCSQEESKTSDVNIFISSTFLDMDRERSIINKVIIPAVKRELKKNNIHFVNINCIDLRWGVPAHFGCTEKLLKYCLEQVKRCDIFVGILGHRYGWIPDDDIITNLSNIYPELCELRYHSITHLEYKLAPSDCYKIFLLQSLEDTYPDISVEEFHAEVEANENFYKYSPDDLMADFTVLIADITRIVNDHFVKQNPPESGICIKHQRPYRQRLLRQSIDRFIEYSSKNIIAQGDSIDEIVACLEHDLKIKVKLFFDRELRDEGHNIVDKKNIPMKETTEKLGGIVSIEGKVGSGKTSLLVGLSKEMMLSTYPIKYNISKNVDRYNFIWFYDSLKYIYRQHGNDISLYDLLYDMIEFLMSLGYDFTEKLKNELNLYGEVCDNNTFWRPNDLSSALPIWYGLLKIIDMVDNLQVTFILDGLEGLTDNETCSLNWIPLSLSSKVRFVITAVLDSTLSRSVKLRNDNLVYEVKPISVKFKRKVIENLLISHGKSLDDTPFNNHMSELTLKYDSDKPKYLGLAINHLLLYATFDKVKETIRLLPSTIDLLISHCLKSIEKEIPKEICMVYFAFIYHGKCGLKIGDLQKLMSVYFKVVLKKKKVLLNQSDFFDLKEASKYSASFSLYPLILIKNLSHVLLEEDRNQRIFIKDESVYAAVTRYCATVNSQVIHYIISLHYDEVIRRSNDEIAYKYIIYHKYNAKMFDECYGILTNIKYIQNRFMLQIANGLLKDYDGHGDNDRQKSVDETWLNITKMKDFKDYRSFVCRNFDLLSTNHELFLQQVLNEPYDSTVRLTNDDTMISAIDFSSDNKMILMLAHEEGYSKATDFSIIRTNEKITAFALSSDMEIFALGFESGLIQIYSKISLQNTFNLRKHTLRINNINFIDNSMKLISVGEDNKALVWNASDGSLLHELKGHQRSVTDTAYCLKADLICTTGLDALCILWKQDTYILHHSFKAKSPINCVRAQNAKIIVGCWNGNMIIYNAIELTKVAVIHNCSSVRSVSINPFYPTFLSSNIEGCISIWNSNKGIKLHEFKTAYNKHPTCATYSSDGLKFLEYGGNNSHKEIASIWSTSMGCHENMTRVDDICCIDSNSTMIVYGSVYGTVTVLDQMTLKVIMTHNVCDAELTAIAVNRSEKSYPNSFLVTDYYCTLHIFEIANETIQLKYKVENIHARPINSLVWDLNYVVSGSEDCSVNVIDLKQRSADNFMTSIKDVFLSSVLAVDSRKGLLLASSKDKSIGLFSMKNNLILRHQLHAHDDWITCVRFISSESFVSGSNDFKVKIWSMNTNAVDLTSPGDSIWSFAATPTTFTVLHSLIGHMGLVTSLAYSKSEIIASSSNDGTIKLWKLQGLFSDNIVTNCNDLPESREEIKWIKFHKKNGSLLALERSGNLHIFNFDYQKCRINDLTSHRDPITCIRDIGDELYTSSFDSSVKMWSYSDVLSRSKSERYRIIDSLSVGSQSGFSSVIVGYADIGFLIFWALDSHTNIWKIIDKIDIKAAFDDHELPKFFTSPYLICELLRMHSDSDIDILFPKLTLRYNIRKKIFRKIKLENAYKSNNVDVESSDLQVNENRFLKFIRKGRKSHFVRIAKDSNFLELLSTTVSKSEPNVMAKLPLNGRPCHVSVVRTDKDENFVFIGYDQGTVDFVAIKQMTN